MNTGQLLGLAAAGVGVWWLGSSLGWFGGAPAVTPTAPTTPTTPSPTGQSAATQSLTAQDANTFLYTSSVTPAQMQALSGQLNQEIQAGQVQQILGTSVLAYMLGWGGASAGQSKSTQGQTYTFDGTNWNLQAPAPAATPATPAAPAPPTTTTATPTNARAVNPRPIRHPIVHPAMGAYLTTGQPMVHTSRSNYRRKSRFA
jgi:hypothetical protein